MEVTICYQKIFIFFLNGVIYHNRHVVGYRNRLLIRISCSTNIYILESNLLPDNRKMIIGIDGKGDSIFIKLLGHE